MNLTARPDYPDASREALLAHVPEAVRRLLDVGCAKGAFGQALKAERDIEVWGVEPDQASAEVASQRLDRVIADFFGPGNPLPDAYFDLITFNDSLEHMPDPVAALEFCRGKLRPGGRINCCVPNMRHIDNLVHLLRDKDWRYEEQGIRDRTHLRFFTEKSIVACLEGSGYVVKYVAGINEDWWRPDQLWRRLLFRLCPGQTRDMRCIQILVVAEKPGD